MKYILKLCPNLNGFVKHYGLSFLHILKVQTANEGDYVEVECRLSKELYFHIKWHDRIWGDPIYMRSFNLNVLTIIY